ncbi:hypothetical protein C1H76_4398 [Elsinoe australis]|uniref:Uncharacterized protein n=1 Tax=Elsinoe australis TaxID=40998 RepID=A0A2P8AJ44_9PEZI|nr:hypothetical protein B9Z65_653 [Elsinoe australis]TKX23331.1 hypothetical protein C1H76_4398 [Elsinoe australis]
MAAVSSKEAAAYLIDPLTAPEPSAETGPGTSFRPPVETPDSGRSRKTSDSNNPFRNPPTSGRHSRHASNASNGTPDKFPNYRETALGQLNDGGTPPSYDAATGHRRRGSSLKERYPGDDSHKPLDILRRDSKKAHRSPHLTKRHMPGTDSIDRLDPTISQVPYHHEGPYDAALLSRNTKPEHSPVAALSGSNAEALKATPRENVKNSLDRHVPLDGTAVVPPGQEDRFGRRYNYEEGSNMMLDGDPAGGQYKRYPGVQYHPDDIKGKGEPSYSQDLARKNRDGAYEEGNDRSIEMQDHHKYASVEHAGDTDAHGRERGNSLMGGLKKRIGSLKKKNRDE